MAWLSVTNEQRDALASLNSDSPSVRVNAIKGAMGGWLACDDAIPYAVDGGPLEHFAEWYALLTPSADVPAPRPPRPSRKTS
jgi:hypothetical protein